MRMKPYGWQFSFDHSHLSQSLPFLRWGWWLSCFLEWDFSLLLRVVCPLWTISCPECCYSSWGYFIFLLMVFLKFLAPYRQFTLKVDSDVSDSFCQAHLILSIETDWLPACMINRPCDIWYAYHSLYEGCWLLWCDAAYSGGYICMLRGIVCLHLQVRRRKMEVLCCCDMYYSMWYHSPSLSDRFVMKC